MNNLIKTGALVTLKSGSPAMTVASVKPADKESAVVCVYFNTETQELSHETIKASLLQIMRPADEDLKIGKAVPLSPVGVYFAFETEDARDEFMQNIINNTELSSLLSTTQH